MAAKKKTTKRRSTTNPPEVSAQTAMAATPRLLTAREQYRNLVRRSDKMYNDAHQAQRERDGLLALIAIAEGHRCIRRLNDEEVPF